MERAYAEHRGSLYGFAVNSLGPTHADDCVQETFLRAWRRRATYRRARGSERTWLFAIARNVVIDQLRARGRRPEDPRAELEQDAPPAPGEHEHVLDRLILTQALAALSPEHREVITAVLLRDQTYEQLSAASGIPVTTLRTRMFYGLRKLRTIMDEEEGS